MNRDTLVFNCAAAAHPHLGVLGQGKAMKKITFLVPTIRVEDLPLDARAQSILRRELGEEFNPEITSYSGLMSIPNLGRKTVNAITRFCFDRHKYRFKP